LIKDIRILVLADSYPYPPTDGRMLRIYNFFKHLRGDYRFDYLSFGGVHMNIDPISLKDQLGPACNSVEFIRSETLLNKAPMSLLSKIRNVFYPYVDTIGEACYSEDMASRVKNKIETGSYELVFVCGLYMLLYIDQGSIRIPFIVDMTDSISLLFRSYFNNERCCLNKIILFLNYVWAERYEKIHCSKLDNIIMCTPVDTEIIRKHCPHSNVWSVPSGVDTDYYRSTNTSVRCKSLLFTGVMDYSPNNSAMIHFINQIFPLIRQKEPDIYLIIAGRNPTAELKRLASRYSGVVVTGYVDDLRPYFESSAIYISPLVTGAGIKNKILEAWSMSLPVVASSLSCSGIEAVSNENILIADTPSEFAEKVLALLQNPELRAKLSANGRATVEQQYSWATRSNMIKDIFEQTLNRKNETIN
jgi:polysaccharide biosynthesis protein PslH